MIDQNEQLLDLSTNTRGIDLDLLGDGSTRKRALIIDDEVEHTTLLKLILMKAGMDVVGATSGSEAVQKCARTKPDLILLDLMMPNMDGWETFRRMREITTAPIIIVSAKTAKEDIVRGFEVGADDYLTKPYHPAELVARVNRLLTRNIPIEKSNKLVFPEIDLTIDLEDHEVIMKNQSIALTGKAFDLLVLLARTAPKSVSNETIAHEIWHEDSPKVQNRIKHLVFVLRQSMEKDPSNPKLILNREKIGYRLSVRNEK